MLVKANRTIALTAAAAIGLTSLFVAPVGAAPAAPVKQQTVKEGQATEFSSHRRHRRSRGNAAAVAAMAGVFGTIAALAARDRYRRHYYYAPYPYYGYYGGPAYRPYYGRHC
jgi:hypothetical protein